ncbi:putative gustatory receptor 28b [Anopheles maculipalpis]|uniref:putative gustatory receptor 28b n=1 Tax=Anopheles maculipalpis TaxID=1496333 RepID=UPI002158CBF3|nr:putative gustatory receptor 28b [Anopheles maculipalpis]
MLNRRIYLHLPHIRSSYYCDIKMHKTITFEAINSIKQNHHLVTTNVEIVIRIVSFPMACLLFVHFIIIISEIFYAYTSIVQDIKNEADVPLGTYMSSILFAIFEAIQFYYIVSASSEITEQAEKMGLLLNEYIPTGPNLRVERCIESFTIELLHQDFKINNCGMYNVDYTLMFSMIATITSYLIMLVQFQLAEF